jgi:hypothetical protein
MCGPTASNSLDTCGAVMATSIGNALEGQMKNLRRVAVAALQEQKRNLISVIIKVAAVRKENCKGEEQKWLPRNPLGGRSSVISPHHCSSPQLHWVRTRNINNRYRIFSAHLKSLTRTNFHIFGDMASILSHISSVPKPCVL